MKLKENSSEQKLRGAYYTPLKLANAMVKLFVSEKIIIPVKGRRQQRRVAILERYSSIGSVADQLLEHWQRLRQILKGDLQRRSIIICSAVRAGNIVGICTDLQQGVDNTCFIFPACVLEGSIAIQRRHIDICSLTDQITDHRKFFILDSE